MFPEIAIIVGDLRLWVGVVCHRLRFVSKAWESGMVLHVGMKAFMADYELF